MASRGAAAMRLLQTPQPQQLGAKLRNGQRDHPNRFVKLMSHFLKN